MIDSWIGMCTAVGDAILGWTLWLPRDLAIVVIGIVVALALLSIRWLTSDAAQLRLFAADERRLRELLQQARAGSDHASLARYGNLRSMLVRRRLEAESITLCISSVVLIAVVLWSQQRLEYLPLKSDDPIRVVAQFPATMIGEIVHIVPLDDVTAVAGWVRVIRAAVENGASCGQSEWTLQSSSRHQSAAVVIRLRNQSVIHRMQVGTARYEPPIQRHDSGIQTEVVLTQYRPLAFIPFRIWPGLPGWSVFLTVVTGAVFWIGSRLVVQTRHFRPGPRAQ